MTVSKDDGKEIIKEVNKRIGMMPILVKPFLRPLPEILNGIPPSARKYSVEEIIQFLEKAYNEGKIKHL